MSYFCQATSTKQGETNSTTKVHLNQLMPLLYGLYLAKSNAPSRHTTTPKGTKFHQKNRSLLVHIVELSTAVVAVDTKVINASLTQNQCLQRVTPS